MAAVIKRNSKDTQEPNECNKVDIMGINNEVFAPLIHIGIALNFYSQTYDITVFPHLSACFQSRVLYIRLSRHGIYPHHLLYINACILGKYKYCTKYISNSEYKYSTSLEGISVIFSTSVPLTLYHVQYHNGSSLELWIFAESMLYS